MALPLYSGRVRRPFFLAVSEQQRGAPQTRGAYQGVDDPGQHSSRAAAQEGHAVEAEQAHAAPVQSADDRQGQRNLVNNDQGNTSFGPPAKNAGDATVSLSRRAGFMLGKILVCSSRILPTSSGTSCIA